MNFNEVLEKLRDGKAYKFGHNNLKGFFYKAPFSSQEEQTNLDGAHSAITYWEGNKKASPTLMLYDFDSNEWYCHIAFRHPSKE